MEGTDDSPARGFKGMLSRRGRAKDESSIDRTDSRSTSESAPEKFKPRPSISEGGTEPGDGKTSRLLSGRKKSKSKLTRKGQQDAGGDTVLPIPGTTSSTSLGVGDGGSANGSANGEERSSTMTSDSELERNSLSQSFPVPPPTNENFLAGSQENGLGSLPGGSTLSVNSADSGHSNRSRSISPGAKIKGAFRSSSKKEKNVDDTSKSLPGLPSLVTKGIDTLASRRLSRSANEGVPSAPYVQTNNAAAQSNKSLPSIVMTPETPPPMPYSLLDKLPTSSYEKLPSVKVPSSPDKADADEAPAPATEAAHVSFNPMPHRRTRSDSKTTAPSKLSQSMNPPLTPMIEEVKTPPSRHASTSSGGGFFTSVFSAAQNAANTLTTTLGNTNRPRSSTSQTHPSDDEKIREPFNTEADTTDQPAAPLEDAGEESKPLAIDTIGSGELSLSHLGFSTDASSTIGGSPAPSTPAEFGQSRSRNGTVVRREEAAAREEGISAARAVSAAYEDGPENAQTPMVEDIADELKPHVAREGSIASRTTPNGSVIDGETGSLLRSTSLKNKLDRKRNRRRGGSQSTIGAAIAASGSSLISANNSSAPKLSGFAVASKKRNRDFHALFRSVPEDDYLIEDYSCALQRDIILAGRIYVSEGHICFSSNILGWITTLVISFDEVVSVEKESTAMVFPNAIAIQTLHARHTFRSLLSRETTYDLLIGIWKISHPGLMSSENGVRVASGTGSKTEKLENGAHSDEGSDGFDDQDVGDEEASEGSDGDEHSSIMSGEAEAAAPDASASPPKSTIPRKPSNIGVTAGAAASPPTAPEAKAAAQANGAAIASVDFPGPQTHAPTECSDQATHYTTNLKDEVIPAPLGKIYTMTFGNASGGFMSRWLLDDMKVLDLQMEDDKKGLGDENKTRSFSYIKPLTGSIGPKQTKCIITEQLDAFDLEKAISITVTTQTPDVPSGNVFSTKTRYCLMWAPNNGTRMIMTCTIEWTGKSWLKGPIEKGANEGQASYANDLYKALRAAVSKGKPAAAGTSGKAKKSKKRKPGDLEKSTASLATSTESKNSDWGLFEPLHGVLGPFADVLGPVFSLHGLIAFLSILLIYSWFRTPSGTSAAAALPRTGRSARIAAYEELWRSEEAALWTWLDQRIGGSDGLAIPIGKGSTEGGQMNADRRKLAQHERQQVLRGENGQFMGEREVQQAVEITEEKLRVLKEAVQKVKRGDPAEERNEL